MKSDWEYDYNTITSGNELSKLAFGMKHKITKFFRNQKLAH